MKYYFATKILSWEPRTIHYQEQEPDLRPSSLPCSALRVYEQVATSFLTIQR